MRHLREFRFGKPGFYPDQSVYAEYACAEFGLSFRDIDGNGLLLAVASSTKTIHFGAGRCSWYPQNDATASSLASDKYFANKILEQADVPTLGGDYFFLHERHRAFRPQGHERSDAIAFLKQLNASAFVKPLAGSRGDFAQTINNEAMLIDYLDEVSRYYDAILIQPLVTGVEYRVFVLDGEVVFTARKTPPHLTGDGTHSIRDLLAGHNARLQSRGLSPASTEAARDSSLDAVLAKGVRWDIPGRMNLSAGGQMILEELPSRTAIDLSCQSVQALGLRAAAVDLFAYIGGDPSNTGVIEVNSSPSIRLLEDSDRGDLILKIWHHTFRAMGLL